MDNWTTAPKTLDNELYQALVNAIHPGDSVPTLSAGKPNRVESITAEGVTVDTERSSKRDGPQLVPAQMLNAAWRELSRRGTLSLTDLRPMRRSSAVCALLARLPNVEVASSRPVTLRLVKRG